MRLSKVVVTILAAVLLHGATASAQPLDDQKRAAARALGEEGLTFFDAGKYADALDRFDRADKLVKAPTLGLMAARSLEKLGRLVEASNRYRDVLGMQLDEKASDVFKEAQTSAAKELEALSPRIPTLEIVIEGVNLDQTTVTLDGKVVPREMVGIRTPLNPGVHRLEATAPGLAGAQDLNIAEKQAARAVLTLQPTAPLKGDGVGSGNGPGDTTPKTAQSTQRTAGLITMGAGGAVFVAGAITGLVGVSKSSELSADCTLGAKGNECPNTPAFNDKLSSYNTVRYVSGAGLIVGGLGLAAGAVLFFTAPKSQKPTKAGVEPWIGLGSAGLRGRF
jgi:hypothetical protein